MLVEDLNKPYTIEASETKQPSSETEDDEILQLKKALLVDSIAEGGSSAQAFENLTPLPIDPRPLIQAQLPSPQQIASGQIPHFNPFSFPNGMVNPQPYTEYPLAINAFPVKFGNGVPNGFQPHPQPQTGLPTSARPPGHFNYLPQDARFSGAQQQQMALQIQIHNRQFQNSNQTAGTVPPYSINNNIIASIPMGFNAVVASETAFRASPTSKPVGTANSAGTVAPENNTRKRGSKQKQQPTVSSPTNFEENTPNESIVFQDKTFRVGDCVVLRDTALDSLNTSGKVIVQVAKFFPSKFGHFQGFIYAQPGSLELAEPQNFHPQELVRTSNKGRFSLEDFLGRCSLLPEDVFSKGHPRACNSLDEIFMLRYRYAEKQKKLFKIRKTFFSLSISEASSLESALQTVKDLPSEFKVPAPPGCPNVIRQPEISSPPISMPPVKRRRILNLPMAVPNPKECRIKVTDDNYIENIKQSFPCDQDNNMLWFNTPPIHRPPKDLEVGLSLNFLVHLAKKRNAKQL